jgi:hypothetical protein
MPNIQWLSAIGYWILGIAGSLEGLDQRPPGQNFGQVPAIFCRGVDIAAGVNFIVGSFLGRRANGLWSGCLTDEHLCRLARIHGAIASTQENQPRLLALILAIQGHQNSDARYAKVVVAAGDL